VAAARTAGTGAATPAPANGVAGGDAKARTGSGIHKINADGAAGVKQTLFHQKFQAAILKNFISVFWLIQSQAQRGACSAALHKGNAQSRINIILLKVFGQFFDCLVGDGKFRHGTPPVKYMVD
jgi:hypothetical protein